ncbi:hypothetical protein N7468_006252 [Penicillium chermesinum]|uniref:Galactosyl transferase n=1 Tax=Penicillium chermesinum TaxID=63820 RepID=A0A9W9NRV6_9EURO|nr:uncharacterized protein N7468_006252 [Penicillium chermesinum]KAJ5225027.1 hypothetical protein N7468_006252 [Penicillium chermesinum]
MLLPRVVIIVVSVVGCLWLWGVPFFPRVPLPSTLLPAKTTDARKIVMVTASSGSGRILSLPNIKEQVYENRMTYAQRHGLEFMWANMTSYNLPNGEGLVWNKMPVLKEAFDRFPDAEWVWWIDIDIIIMNMSLNLTGAGGGETGYRTPAIYNYDDINFVIPEDHWGMNAGNFLMRRSEWSDWLLDMWLEPLFVKENWVFAENDAWTHMWQNHEIVRKHSACVSQRSMNSYPASNPLGESWQAGDFLIHFAGCDGGGECPNNWKRYWALREQVEVPMSVHKKLADGTAEIENTQRGVGMPLQ